MLEPAGANPGKFPVTAKIDRGAGWQYDVTGARVITPPERFRSVDVEDAPARSTWLVWSLEDNEDVEPIPAASRSSRRVVAVQARAALGAGAPALATDGIEILPAFGSLNLYFDGLTADVQVYVRSVGGNWRKAELILLTDTSAGEGVFARLVDFGGGRIAFATAGAGNLEIDAEVQP